MSVYGTEGEALSLALAGDAIVTRRVSTCEDEDFRAVVEGLRGADAAIGNLEVLLCEYDDGYPAAESGGTYMRAPPWVADELEWMGFDAFAAATNHTGDYGIGGVEATMEHLEAREIPYAGLGRTLATAREPAYVETPAGRVAIVSVCSTITPGTVAGAQRPDLRGRPGLAPLRFDTVYEVEPDHLAAIEAASEALGLEGLKTRAERLGFPVPGEDEDEDGFTLINAAGTDVRFAAVEPDEEPGVRMTADEDDVAAATARIDEASRQADWVLASLHGHEGAAGGLNDRVVPAFHEAFAHACVDAGADVFLGHGSHLLRGIELYDGAPIFYSLGDFAMQNETVTRLPAEIYDRYDLGDGADPADLFDERVTDEAGERAGFLADSGFWESVLPVCEFADGSLDRIELRPLELGFEAPRAQRGRPRVASGETATRILEELADLSAPYGTELAIEDGRATIEPDA